MPHMLPRQQKIMCPPQPACTPGALTHTLSREERTLCILLLIIEEGP